MINSVVGPTRSSKALPKAKLPPKKVIVTVWWSAALLIHYSFLNPGETITSEKYALQINQTHWKLQHLQLHWSTKRAQFFSRTAPDHMSQLVLQKLKELSYRVLPHLPYSPDLSPTEYHRFKHLENLLQEKHIHNQQEAENAFQEFVESWSTYFYATWISKLISYWQKYVDCQFSSVTQSCPTLCNPMDCSMPGCSPCPCPSTTPGVYSNSWSLSWWCHPAISSSVVPFSFHL